MALFLTYKKKGVFRGMKSSLYYRGSAQKSFVILC